MYYTIWLFVDKLPTYRKNQRTTNRSMKVPMSLKHKDRLSIFVVGKGQEQYP